MDTIQDNRHKYFSISPIIAMQLVKEWIKPYNQPLGIPFGWIQPEDNTTITLGSVYSCNYEKNLYDILFSEDYNYNTRKYELTCNLSLDSTKRILGILHINKKNIRKDKIILPDVIFQNEEINTTFDKLDNTEKCMYRLSILMLNTMTSGHNLACEYLEYLAHTHFNNAHDKNWALYDGENNTYQSEILEILCENPESLNIQLNYDSPEYRVEFKNEILDSVHDFIDNLESTYNDGADYDYLQDVFNVTVKWDRDEISTFLKYVMSFIIDEYNQGFITFQYTDNADIDSKELKQWLYQYENQIIMFK